MPFFASKAPVDFDAVASAWSRLFPRLAALQVERSNDAVVTFVTPSAKVMTVHMPTPIPREEILAAIRSSWMWQQPDASVRDHQSHAIVTAAEPENLLGAATQVARVSAAMLEAAGGVGVYWGAARQVLPPKVVQGFAVGDRAPVPLCVGITISASDKEGPFSAATHGLEALGHKEIEVRKSQMPLGKLRMSLYDMASYMLESGRPLKHGQTIGPDAQTHWSIRHEKSTLVPGRDVIVLGIP